MVGGCKRKNKERSKESPKGINGSAQNIQSNDILPNSQMRW
jgi:hypothetical protein